MTFSAKERIAMGAPKPLDNRITQSKWIVWIAETADSMRVEEVSFRASSEARAYALASEYYPDHVIRAIFPA